VLEVNGTRQPLRPPGMVVGRGEDADLRINDPGVSRKHAEIRVSPGKDAPLVTVVDLGSTNGTHVNGHRVDRAALSEGSTIRVGNTMLKLHFMHGGDDEQ
jgi:pSer/pThr/pTyr-binding forkhead associated (FHA) protein